MFLGWPYVWSRGWLRDCLRARWPGVLEKLGGMTNSIGIGIGIGIGPILTFIVLVLLLYEISNSFIFYDV